MARRRVAAEQARLEALVEESERLLKAHPPTRAMACREALRGALHALSNGALAEAAGYLRAVKAGLLLEGTFVGTDAAELAA